MRSKRGVGWRSRYLVVGALVGLTVFAVVDAARRCLGNRGGAPPRSAATVPVRSFDVPAPESGTSPPPAYFDGVGFGQDRLTPSGRRLRPDTTGVPEQDWRRLQRGLDRSHRR